LSSPPRNLVPYALQLTDFGAQPASLRVDTKGNGYNNGQVLLGNALRSEQIRGAFNLSAGVCRALPAPSLQRPDLLQAPPQTTVQPPACAVAVAVGEQSATINQIMAALMASYVERLLDRRCAWMASYVDMDNGTLQCVPADPRQVVPIVSLHVNALVDRGHHEAQQKGRAR
jgi:hypothetical protein